MVRYELVQGNSVGGGLDDDPKRAATCGKAASLFVLVQFSVYALARAHLSRGVCDTEILVVAEVMKGGACLVGCACTRAPWPRGLGSFAKVLPVALSFLIMNFLGMACSSLVPAAIFAVLMQLKLVFTAVTSWLWHGKPISTVRRYALAAVTLGCIGASAAPKRTGVDPQWVAVGALGLVLETLLSGVSSVYMQSLLQEQKESLLVRNVQLSGASLLVYGPLWMVDPRCNLAPPTPADWLLSSLGAVGGVGVALALRYAGAVEKTLATSAAIVVTTLVEAWLQAVVPPVAQLTNIAVVVLGVGLYGHGA